MTLSSDQQHALMLEVEQRGAEIDRLARKCDKLRTELERLRHGDLSLRMQQRLSDCSERANAAEVEISRLKHERQQAIDALRVYADARHWAISRDDLAVRVLSWIGPGMITNGVPDAMETARAALLSLGEQE